MVAALGGADSVFQLFPAPRMRHSQLCGRPSLPPNIRRTSNSLSGIAPILPELSGLQEIDPSSRSRCQISVEIPSRRHASHTQI